ncbi:MAG: efflux RND transporter periplasmic adaptor subunit [Bryobacteraceae bacterium]|nr:efflux RND transporter periplasmic adaptor subunit [Bryobacteraceae bacterium]
MKTPYTLWLILASAVTLLCSSCGTRDSTAQAAVSSMPVSIMEARPATIPIHQEYIGTTFSLDTVQVNSRVNGYIERWLFRPGDFVTAGQLLYVIDQRTYKADMQRAEADLAKAEAQLIFAREGVEVTRGESELAQAEATLVKAEQDVARVKPLVAATALPGQELDAVTANQRVAANHYRAREANVKQLRLLQKTNIDQAGAAVEAAKAARRQAELNLSFTEIHAPAAGRIGETRVQVGGLALASSPEPLTLISPLDPIYVEFAVNERDYLEYSKEQFAGGRVPKETLAQLPLELMLSDGSRYPQTGRFRFADRSVDTKTGTLKLTGAFPNPNRLLLPGQFSRIRLQRGTKVGVYLVPQRAVQEMQGLLQVFLLDGKDRVIQRTVTATERTGNSWVIEKGLQPGDRIVVDGLQKVGPGAATAPRVLSKAEIEAIQ